MGYFQNICIRMNVKIFSINSNACCYLTIAIYSEREYRGVFPEKENVVLK